MFGSKFVQKFKSFFSRKEPVSVARHAPIEMPEELFFGPRIPVSTGGGGRKVYPFNHHWRYSGKKDADASSPDFEDTGWEEVVLPHTNTLHPWHGLDQAEHQFVSSYRRHFASQQEWKGKRVFVDFAGAMTASTVSINGHTFEEYKGGYTPFSFELTDYLKDGQDNVLAVKLDSTERADIPPFGNNVDYLAFGGIYRDVQLRVVPQTFIENVHVETIDPLRDSRSLNVICHLNGAVDTSSVITVELYDGDKKMREVQVPATGAQEQAVSMDALGEIELWDLNHPKLYNVAVRLTHQDGSEDEYHTRVGFRHAEFTPDGFQLNGKTVKLMGLNRHQNYPYVGGAMPARVQRRDAWILKKEMHCNIVRTSHYPQSPDFLDACDELGLLVLEEIPGWQHIGDKNWQDLAVRNVGEMIQRDCNHPSIILWGVRINESADNHEFYTRTNALAHDLDKTRQTGGIRCNYMSEFLEDVFTYNEFNPLVRPPHHLRYLISEFNGHMFPTKRTDNTSHISEHVLRYARMFNTVASHKRYAGGIGWCAFDYNTHDNFGSGDNVCYHGVSDIFRIPKPAAFVLKSQCDPAEEVVLEAGFYWTIGDKAGGGGPGKVPILSNCETLKVYLDGVLKKELKPDRKAYPNLKHPPFMMDLGYLNMQPWGDLKIEGYIGGQLVKTLTLSGSGKNADLKVLPDDTELEGDGRDATRVVLEITDEYGNIKPQASGAVTFELKGPGEIVGENPFSLAGGVGAVWVKATEKSGTIKLTAKHQYLGKKTIEIKVKKAEPEAI